MTAAPNIDLAKCVACYGTFAALAKRLNLSLSTVHGWHLRGSIPSWRRKEIARVAKRDGYDIEKKKKARRVKATG